MMMTSKAQVVQVVQVAQVQTRDKSVLAVQVAQAAQASAHEVSNADSPYPESITNKVRQAHHTTAGMVTSMVHSISQAQMAQVDQAA